MLGRAKNWNSVFEAEQLRDFAVEEELTAQELKDDHDLINDDGWYAAKEAER